MSCGVLMVERSHQIEPPIAFRNALTKAGGATRYDVRLSDGALWRRAPPGFPSPAARETELGNTLPALSMVTAVHPSVLESNVLTARTFAVAGLARRPLATMDAMRMRASMTG